MKVNGTAVQCVLQKPDTTTGFGRDLFAAQRLVVTSPEQVRTLFIDTAVDAGSRCAQLPSVQRITVQDRTGTQQATE
jgi:hypothetical protein